jgi:Family of unknown function (DUF6064)
MNLPFSQSEFFAVFAAYNSAVWPVQLLLVGFGVVVVGAALRPRLASLLGQQFPATPTFGLPCPTTIFTLGVLLWLQRPAPVSLLVIPLAWSVIGTAAALQLGVGEDFGLVVAGVLTVVLRFVPRAGLSALERGRPLLEK